MGRVKQVKQEEASPEPIQNQIRKGRRRKVEKVVQNKQVEKIYSPPPIKRQKRAKNIEKVESQEKNCKNLEPKSPYYLFPEDLENQLALIIISFENFVELNEILKHLTQVYKNEIDLEIVCDQLASSEEEGTIFEKGGKYSVTGHYLSDFPQKKQENSKNEQEYESLGIFDHIEDFQKVTLIPPELEIQDI